MQKKKFLQVNILDFSAIFQVHQESGTFLEGSCTRWGPFANLCLYFICRVMHLSDVFFAPS